MVYTEKDCDRDRGCEDSWDLDRSTIQMDELPARVTEKKPLLERSVSVGDYSETYPLWPQLCASLVSCLGALSSGIINNQLYFQFLF